MSDTIAEIQGADIPLELVPVKDPQAAVGADTSEAPQYIAGFNGAAIQPFSEEAAKILAEPIDPRMVEIKPDGIVYLPWVFFQQRLNRAFGPGGHALLPRGPARKIGDTITYHGALFVLGRFVSEAVGECEYHASNSNMSYAATLEGARSDCRVRCCKDLGIAMELWDPSWREKWIAEWAHRAWVPGQGNYKAKFYYWRKDRDKPWQVEKANAKPEGGRGATLATSPKGTDASAPSRSSEPKGSASEAGAKATSQGKVSSGSSQEHEPGQDDESLEDFIQLLDAVKWAKPKVTAWLDKYFGCKPDQFTNAQMHAACTLLMAWHKDPKGAYQETVKSLQAAGVIRSPEPVGPEPPV